VRRQVGSLSDFGRVGFLFQADCFVRALEMGRDMKGLRRALSATRSWRLSVWIIGEADRFGEESRPGGRGVRGSA
jgi:hypothetical protein